MLNSLSFSEEFIHSLLDSHLRVLIVEIKSLDNFVLAVLGGDWHGEDKALGDSVELSVSQE